jgi:hypothetical protein
MWTVRAHADTTVRKFATWFHSGIRLRNNVMATLWRVRFDGNRAETAELSGIAERSFGPALGLLTGQEQRARAWVYDCEFVDNFAGVDADAASDNSRNEVFSNTAAPRVWVHDRGGQVVDPLPMTLSAFSDGQFRFFPTEEDTPFQVILRVRGMHALHACRCVYDCVHCECMSARPRPTRRTCAGAATGERDASVRAQRAARARVAGVCGPAP